TNTGARGTGRRDLLRVLLEREGLRIGATDDRGGVDRCGSRGRRGFALPDDVVWLSFAPTGFTPAVPAVRYCQRWDFYRGGRRVRFVGEGSRQPGCRCDIASRPRRIERCLSHVLPSS